MGMVLVLSAGLLGGLVGAVLRRRVAKRTAMGPFRKEDHTEQVVGSGFTNMNGG